MTSKTKSKLQLGLLIVLYLIIGGIGGPIFVDWLLKIGETNPIIIFVVAIAVVIFIGIGAGIKALAKVVKVQANPIFCYLPVAQDMVVYSVVRGIVTKNSLHEKLKKFNFLLTGTALVILSIAVLIGSPLIFNKILSGATTSNTEDVATLMVTVNTTLNLIITAIFLIAYIIRVVYFDYIFRLVYKSTVTRVLAILPPIHLILIAILPNQLSYLRNAKGK